MKMYSSPSFEIVAPKKTQFDASIDDATSSLNTTYTHCKR